MDIENERLRTRCAEMAAEIERLQQVAEITNKDLHRLQSIIDDANAKEVVAYINDRGELHRTGAYIPVNTELFSRPIPAQQSPAVAVPACWQWAPVEPTPEMIAACENARSYNTSAYMIWKEMIAVAPSNSQHLSPRITEQDALPDAYREEWKRNVMLMWSCVRKHDSSIPSDVLDYMREQLLNKLNAKPESVGGSDV